MAAPGPQDLLPSIPHFDFMTSRLEPREIVVKSEISRQQQQENEPQKHQTPTKDDSDNDDAGSSARKKRRRQALSCTGSFHFLKHTSPSI